MTDTELTVDPVLGMRSRFWTTGDGDGAVLHVEVWIDPGGGVTPHSHPEMTERFEVLDGRCEFLSGRTWSTVGPDDGTVVVPPGTRHAFRNRSATEAHIVAHATPPSSLQEFLEDAAALSRAGAINRHGLPTGLDGLLRAARLAHRHRDMVVLGSPLPPRWVQRVLLPPLARLGARRELSRTRRQR